MKVQLEEIQGGARVLQLWQAFKAQRSQARTFNEAEFNTQVCDFVFRAMDALEHGRDVLPPDPPAPEIPSWLKSLPNHGTVDFQKRQMHARGWSVERIEAVDPAYYDKILKWGWTEENIRKDQEAAAAEMEVKKRRWPKFFK